MKNDEIVARIRAVEPALFAAGAAPAPQQWVDATLRVLAERLDMLGEGEQLEVPPLGAFTPRPLAKPGAPRKLLFVPAPRPAAPTIDPAAWRKALRTAERPLIDPQRRFVVLFSAKSACSTVVIWFMHQLGLAAEARRHSEWPHDFRQQRFYERPDYLAARDALQPAEAVVLRVVRDPVERAGSSFRHALGTSYARESMRQKIGVDSDVQGLSLERFIDFLEAEDLDRCDPHHRRQRHALERLRPADVVINASEQDLFEGLNAFERRLGLPVTDFASLAWVHELQATRVPQSVATDGDPYRRVLTREQAQHGPWPKGLLTAEARMRLQRLYADDIALYTHPLR